MFLFAPAAVTSAEKNEKLRQLRPKEYAKRDEWRRKQNEKIAARKEKREAKELRKEERKQEGGHSVFSLFKLEKKEDSEDEVSTYESDEELKDEAALSKSEKRDTKVRGLPKKRRSAENSQKRVVDLYTWPLRSPVSWGGQPLRKTSKDVIPCLDSVYDGNLIKWLKDFSYCETFDMWIYYDWNFR